MKPISPEQAAKHRSIIEGRLQELGTDASVAIERARSKRRQLGGMGIRARPRGRYAAQVAYLGRQVQLGTFDSHPEAQHVLDCFWGLADELEDQVLAAATRRRVDGSRVLSASVYDLWPLRSFVVEEAAVLLALSREALRVADLAASLTLPLSSTSDLVERMERKGLVMRHRVGSEAVVGLLPAAYRILEKHGVKVVRFTGDVEEAA